MRSLEIPYNFPKSLSQLLSQDECIEHKDSYQRNRHEVVNILRRMPEVVKCAKELNQGTVYKIVLTPENGKLTSMGNNIYQAVFREKGKIVQHARLQAINPNMVANILTCTKGIGTQVLLIKIAMDINDIKKEMHATRQEFTNDRIEQINSGIQMYEQAMTMRDKKNQRMQIINTCQTLNEGVFKLIKDLKGKIKDMPDVKPKFHENWRERKTLKAKEKYKNVKEIFWYCLNGVFTLTKCYASIGEVETAKHSLRRCIYEIKSCGIDEAAAKARLVPYDEGDELPEYCFQLFLDYSSHDGAFMKRMQDCESFAKNEFDDVEIEIKPSELLLPKNT